MAGSYFPSAGWCGRTPHGAPYIDPFVPQLASPDGDARLLTSTTE